MEGFIDYTLIDVRSDSERDEASSELNQAQNENCPATVVESTCNQRPSHPHAELVRDFKVIMEQSLENFEGRLTARITDQMRQQGQAAETPSNAQGPVHENVYCDHCNSVIVGIRYKCGMCQDYDLCERCESQRPHQQRSHLFIKIYEPLAASLNQRPLLPPDLGATNPFRNLLSSMGIPPDIEATLEVAHDGPLEIRELAQANGCQFYLRNGGRQLCKDYQLVNHSGRDIQSGEYRLEHMFSTGLFPLDAKLPVPEIPDGDVRIVCVAWQLPHQQLLSTGEEQRPMRQATSVYRLKDRQGRQLGEPISASVVILQLPQQQQQQQQQQRSAEAQTEDAGLIDDSFELIGDDELPSCFVLPVAVQSPSPPPPAKPAAAAAMPVNSCANYSCADEEDNATVVLPDKLIESDDAAAEPTTPTPSSPPPLPPRASSTAAAAAAAATSIECWRESTAVEAAPSALTPPPPPPPPPPSHSASWTSASLIAKLVPEVLDTVHPSTVQAAAYVPKKTAQWMPPPKPDPRLVARLEASRNNNSSSGCGSRGSSVCGGSDANSCSSGSSPSIWGQSGEASERAKLQKLLEMGFYRRDTNAKVMRECDWDFELALNRLSEMYKEL